jgi:hypothetical protein
VAIYYLGMKSFGRSQGQRGSRATSGAAYRAGERIRDERTGAVYDHRNRRDVLHKEIVVPAWLAAAGHSVHWARDRSSLWNAAELAERNRNARVAREFTVALPHELSPQQRLGLARQFAQEISDRYGSAVDLAIHAPRGDPRNFHAHLFSTTREVTPEGLGPKTTLELSGTERHRRGLARWGEELAFIRERWAGLANESLREARVAARITALSRTEALSRGSTRRLPIAAYHMERRGEHSFIAERIRVKHRTELAQASGRIGEQIRARTQATWAALRARFQGLRSALKPTAHVAAPERTRERATREARSAPEMQSPAREQRSPAPEQRSPARARAREVSQSLTAQPGVAREAQALQRRDRALESAREWAADRRAGRWGPEMSLEERQREAVRNWLAHREARLRGSDAPEPEKAKTRGHDLDLGL